MEQYKIDRISELARKAKIQQLDDQELAEQAALRREYIDNVKSSLTSALDNTYIMDKKGNKTPIKKKDGQIS
ncbi:MAG: DUF896 domain-containing protein [Clostridiaceae bacterium]|nr:DUF896 domain-containing protein [Clostridiaceae bacterium]